MLAIVAQAERLHKQGLASLFPKVPLLTTTDETLTAEHKLQGWVRCDRDVGCDRSGAPVPASVSSVLLSVGERTQRPKALATGPLRPD